MRITLPMSVAAAVLAVCCARASAETLELSVGAARFPVSIDGDGNGRHAVDILVGPGGRRQSLSFEVRARPGQGGRTVYAYSLRHELLGKDDALRVEASVALPPGGSALSYCGGHQFMLARPGAKRSPAAENEPTSVLVGLADGRQGVCAIAAAPGAPVKLSGTMTIGDREIPVALELASTLSPLDAKRRALTYDLSVEGERWRGRTELTPSGRPKTLRAPRKRTKAGVRSVALGIDIPLD